MALRKNIPNATQYQYLVIANVYYSKTGGGHSLHCDLHLRDSADSSADQVQQHAMRFEIPTGGGNPLSVALQNPAGANLVALAYCWLKGNVPLLADWEDA